MNVYPSGAPSTAKGLVFTTIATTPLTFVPLRLYAFSNSVTLSTSAVLEWTRASRSIFTCVSTPIP